MVNPSAASRCRRMLSGLVAAICLASTSASGAQLSAKQEKAIDSAVTGLHEEARHSGLLGFARTQRCSGSRQGYGRASPREEAKAETVYRIGSLTKQFTAGLALMASNPANQSPLDVDTPVSAHFPEQKQWTGISVRHLLTHTSGIPTYTASKQFRRHQFDPVAPEALLKLVKAYKQHFKPGSKGHYSNSNYLLLTHILQNHTSATYGDLLLHNVFRPLGMTSTSIIETGRPGSDVARGSVKGSFISKRTHPNWALGVGDLQSSVVDIAQWNMALLSNRLLTIDAKTQMFTSVAKNIEPAVKGERLAMGWMDISDGGAKRFYHQGYLHGFSAVNYLQDPFGTGNRFVTILCNGHLVQKMPELAVQIARLL